MKAFFMEETAPQTPEKKSLNKGIIAIALVVVVAVAIVGYEATKPKENAVQTVASEATTAPKKTDETPNEEAASAYKNGTYNVTGNYTSPGGPESIDVTVTLENDVITEVDVVANATRPISKEKQGIFIANFEPQVIGKKIDDVKLDKVSSSSLTPKGFNDALEKVKEQAKA